MQVKQRAAFSASPSDRCWRAPPVSRRRRSARSQFLGSFATQMFNLVKERLHTG